MNIPNFSKLFDERVIDVEYSEIENGTKESNADKRSRVQQISEAAKKHFPLGDGLSSFLDAMIFSVGAVWADEHPRNSFPSKAKWGIAMAKELNSHMPDGEAASDPVYQARLLLTFAAGASWADKNPYKL